MFGADVYVRITRNLFRVKNLRSGVEAQGMPEKPFDDRALRELAMDAGAKKVVVWIGARLSDTEVSAKLKEREAR